jgi:hypothetical protein
VAHGVVRALQLPPPAAGSGGGGSSSWVAPLASWHLTSAFHCFYITTMNENSLRSCLDDNTDGIVAIQAFMGGWPARASGKFEHRYNIKYDTKKVLHFRHL